eukprot:5791978-Amphidinium_carterae.1
MLKRRRIASHSAVPSIAHTKEWHSMDHCGYNHALSECAMFNGTAGQVGAFVACLKCGAYLCHRSEYLKKDCTGPVPPSSALRSQQRSIQRGLHPLARQCYKGYTLQLMRGTTREDLMNTQVYL